MNSRAILSSWMFTVAAAAGGCASPHVPPPSSIEAPAGTPRPPYRFDPADSAFLDQVQRGAFNFLWQAGRDTASGMAPDRSSKPTVSIAGVGFQLSGICIGVERGWITRSEGEDRTLQILRALAANPNNRKAGLYYHFLNPADAGQPAQAYEHVVSTIDSALFFAGVLSVSQYFGGEVQKIGDRLFNDADWRFFVAESAPDPLTNGFVSLGWKPSNINAPTGDGKLLPYAWIDSGDEHRLVTFLGVCAPTQERRVDPEVYFRMRRQLGEYGDTGPFVWFPWSGALFTAFFAHCWIDYAGVGPDNPDSFGVRNRTSVDWWENSRRTVRMHRLKSVELAGRVPALGPAAWGLTASDVKGGYAVPGLFPRLIRVEGYSPGADFADAKVKDNFGDGTIAPYGAGSCIIFDPAASIEALRHYRGLTRPDGSFLAWDDPAHGGFGFRDAFNLGTGWAAQDFLAIDQGPLLLSIENARTGLIWRLFHSHPYVQAGTERLKLPAPAPRTPGPFPAAHPIDPK